MYAWFNWTRKYGLYISLDERRAIVTSNTLFLFRNIDSLYALEKTTWNLNEAKQEIVTSTGKLADKEEKKKRKNEKNSYKKSTILGINEEERRANVTMESVL